MNIIIVSNYYFPELGAASSRITNLAEGLVEKGHNVDVICPIPNYPKGKIFEGYKGRFTLHEKINNVALYRYWTYPSVSKNPVVRIISMFSFALSFWLFAFKRTAIIHADIVIVQNSPLLVSLSAIALFKKLFNKKIALNVSDLWPLSALELGAIKKGKFYTFLEWVERFNYNNSKLILGQTQKILSHVREIVNKPEFLYRNIPKTSFDLNINVQMDPIKIIYAGLLGVAQGVYDTISNVDFKVLEVEMHIYGDGNEKEKIETHIKKHAGSNIFYHGSLPKNELNKILPSFYAALVPVRILEAAPSKMFEFARAGVPLLYCGIGEGAIIAEKYQLGYTSKPDDYKKLSANIKKISQLKKEEYLRLKNNCLETSKSIFNFDKQLDSLVEKLELTAKNNI